MTRAEQIQILSRRYWNMMRQRKWKSANMIYARMRELMTKQIRWENRKCNS